MTKAMTRKRAEEFIAAIAKMIRPTDDVSYRRETVQDTVVKSSAFKAGGIEKGKIGGETSLYLAPWIRAWQGKQSIPPGKLRDRFAWP
jgi:hypothetical protein